MRWVDHFFVLFTWSLYSSLYFLSFLLDRKNTNWLRMRMIKELYGFLFFPLRVSMERLVVQGRLVQGWAYCSCTVVYQSTALSSAHKQSPSIFICHFCRVNVEPLEREVIQDLMGYQDPKEAQEPLDLMVPRLESDFYSLIIIKNAAWLNASIILQHDINNRCAG